jgi:hypothetical protein
VKLLSTFITICFFANFYASAQGSAPATTAAQGLNLASEPPALTSPNAASLGLYGEVPVSLYTGLPSITVPLYTVTSGSNSLPLALSYHASGFQPDTHPGWVGMGWSLQAGGVINRTVRDVPDDYSNPNYPGAYVDLVRAGLYYDPKRLTDLTCRDPSCTTSLLYGSQDYMRYLAADERAYWLDTEPDEFSFNVGGYSGKFYISYNESTKSQEWKVQCDKPMRVNFASTDMLTPPFTPYGIAETRGNYYSPSFGRFTLTAEDGTQFIFGGTTNAIEYSIGFFGQQKEEWIANSWYLTQIIYPTNQKIDFTYERDNFISQAYVSIYQQLQNQYTGTNTGPSLKPGNNDFDCSRAITRLDNPVERSFSAKLVSPVYLSTISGPTTTVRFIRSKTIELRVDNAWYQARYNYDTYGDAPAVNADGSPGYPNFPFLQQGGRGYAIAPEQDTYKDFPACMDDRLIWKKLEYIEVSDKKGVLYKKFFLDYSRSTTERLTLLSVTEIGTNSQAKPPYSFTYQDRQNLPGYIANKNDHWGFYNARRIPAVRNSYGAVILDYAGYYASREPAAAAADYLKGMLTRITYPTGGCTTFEYEQHTYANQVQIDRSTWQQVDPAPAGGLRIHWIRSYSSPTADPLRLASAKEYLYAVGYTGNNGAILRTSGVLGGKIVYEYNNYNQIKVDAGNNDSGSYSSHVFSSQSGLPAGTNAQGSHIGYSQVVEKRSDGSFIKYYYTNFDNGHGDESASAAETLQPTRTPYEPYSSKEQERGLLQKEEQYTNLGVCVKRRAIYYRSLSQVRDYVRTLKAGRLLLCDNGASTANILEATLYRNYTYSYLPFRERETLFYSTNASDSLATVKEYDYTTDKLLAEERVFDSQNQLLRTTYKYPTSFSYGASLPAGSVSAAMQAMLPANKHMLAYPVETCNYRNGKLIGVSINTYQLFGTGTGIIRPYQALRLESDRPLDTDPAVATAKYVTPNFSNATPTLDSKLILQATATAYDDYGNLLSISKKGNSTASYLWGYNRTLPIAEVKEATPAQIAYTSFETDGVGGWGPSDGSGGWGYSIDATHLLAVGGHTGSRAYQLDSKGGVHHGQLPAGDYELSFWLQGDAPPVFYGNLTGAGLVIYLTNGSGIDSTPQLVTTTGDWRQYRVRLRFTAMGEINLDSPPSGATPLLDDLRLMPVGAQMTTYTHDPLNGITSRADINNMPTYFEYDGLQRLHLLKDYNSAIQQQYKYNYQH